MAHPTPAAKLFRAFSPIVLFKPIHSLGRPNIGPALPFTDISPHQNRVIFRQKPACALTLPANALPLVQHCLYMIHARLG
jgi:hypothetical protein